MRGCWLERLKANILQYHKEQKRQFEKTFHYKAQQEHFIHEIFSPHPELLDYQQASQHFLTARGEILLLLLKHHAYSGKHALQYLVPMPDRQLPFYMAYIDDRLNPRETTSTIPENLAKVTVHMELLNGFLKAQGSPSVTVEKDFAKGNVVLGEEQTRVYLPYAGYRAIDDKRVRYDAHNFLQVIRALGEQTPCIIPK